MLLGEGLEPLIVAFVATVGGGLTLAGRLERGSR